jgi:hypothetical protein
MTGPTATATSADASPGVVRLRTYDNGALLSDVSLGWHAAIRLASDLLIEALIAYRALKS